MSKPQVIGLISEDPYDSTALRNLLERYYNIQLKAVLKNVKGSQLDSPKAKKLLGIELKSKKYKHIIYSRDLDGPRSDSKKLAERNQWFKNLDALNKNTGIFLLHIYELESLIFADMINSTNLLRQKLSLSKTLNQSQIQRND